VYSNAYHQGVSAKPFMQPAWDAQHPKAAKLLGVRLRERIIIEALKEGKKR